MPDRRSAPAVLSRNLVAYLLSRFCSGSAMTMLRAGIAWHVFALTNSAFHLGLIGAVQFVPALGLLLVAGTLADVWDRQRIMMGAQTLALSCAGVLLWATASGQVTVMLLYGLILLIAVAAAFENPSRAALLPTLVPREIFPRAVTVATTNQALAFASGPALGGLLIASRGIAAVYAAYIVLVCCALASLAFVRPERSDGPRGAPTLRAMREGLVLRATATGGPRLHGARHVRGDLRRRRRAAADLRARHPAGGRARLRAPHRVARDRRSRHVGHPRHATSDPAHGTRPAAGGGRLRPGDDCLRPVTLVPALRGRVHARRHGRPGERRDAQHGHPALHAGRAPRPRERGEPALHRRVEPARARRNPASSPPSPARRSPS